MARSGRELTVDEAIEILEPFIEQHKPPKADWSGLTVLEQYKLARTHMLAKKERKRVRKLIRADKQDETFDPTPEQQEKFEYERVNVARIDTEQPIGAAPRNKQTSQLERLFNKSLIDERQYEAGAKFREHWNKAGIQQRTTGAYEEPTGAPEKAYGMPVTEAQAHYRGLWRDAMDALQWGKIGKMAVNVICFDHTPTSIGDGSRPAISGMTRVRFILDLLGGHYKIYPKT